MLLCKIRNDTSSVKPQIKKCQVCYSNKSNFAGKCFFSRIWALDVSYPVKLTNCNVFAILLRMKVRGRKHNIFNNFIILCTNAKFPVILSRKEVGKQETLLDEQTLENFSDRKIFCPPYKVPKVSHALDIFLSSNQKTG